MTAVCHVMLDTETLGTRPGCVVLAAAFVRFEDEAHCSLNLSTLPQYKLGGFHEESTCAWWRDQDPEAWRLATENPVDTYAGIAQGRLELCERVMAWWAENLPILMKGPAYANRSD